MKTWRAKLWSGFVRVPLFWFVFIGVLWGIDQRFSDVDFHLLMERGQLAYQLSAGALSFDAVHEALDALSKTDFILSLAYGVVSIAFAFLVSFFVCHVLVIAWTLRMARRAIAKCKTLEEFYTEYDNGVHASLRSNGLIGDAWREFDETLVAPQEDERQVLRNTVRPHTFMHVGLARERLVGIKMLPAIPGYFVAVGLLLTFIGIVLALYKAGEASSVQDVTVMQKAMTDLLQIASFKFATSIAGLGCSLVLSVLFKLFMVLVEGSFSDLCEAIERKLLYVAPQSLAVKMNSVMEEQRDELKHLGSEKYFSQMGQALSPQIHSAFSEAMLPVNQSISNALDKVTESSQSGISDMLQEFSNNVQGSAGTELRELAGTLQAMQTTLADMQGGVRNSGEDFARRMSEAAENLNRLVSEAATSMNDGALSNRESLNEIIAAMQSTFEKANNALDEDLGKAAAGASSKIEDAMGRVMEKLEGQITHLSEGMASMEGNLSGSVQKTQDTIQEAQQSAAQTVASVATNTSEALKQGLADALATIRNEIDRFETALEGSKNALTSQASAIGDATSQTRQVADIFSKTAIELRGAIAPFTQSAGQIAETTHSFKTSLNAAVEALQNSQEGSSELANALRENGEELTNLWQSYEKRFQNIDEELGRAVESLSKATVEQGAALSNYSQQVDQNLAQAVTKLSSGVSEINDSIEEFGEEVGKLQSAMYSAVE
ncbi:anti-phage ZorAB system protein ZorA [Cohaesibacter celericrescens]|uniref:MotA/TolQ/ExbB proton channel domain-containing protein n=1 Tax=Cohaesibacter celericrescens TaxID=2067669 RepID=A0A2N5XT53_9HYPH|nr:anti-phage ZorAB system protein ZorA [Cohaesibacter celericrescens]PLW77684.1 hypothetical protein C0081_10370 [Cohaesibacter celericrescens]